MEKFFFPYKKIFLQGNCHQPRGVSPDKQNVPAALIQTSEGVGWH
jgi:hypothetical protein